ncbi:hypothetical protein [Ruminiclostridium cellulolyticum]|uniref:Uncharacterized protein n=1 Tax=Ruminiclostridium cellulolyticum (strain ATCC 35319 / DSM 5812 / JCM 6584 / H10) TaxID=394503 RepID=B8I1B2_RUMCH|nr:hypothetical protein [Ruminiclostridium cellulolyticum]ACL75710.1 conserved hypothetical protein [Ruminiclostridium cellulolyticum H10]
MKSSHTPYYNIPDYYFDDRQNNNIVNAESFPTGIPTGGPFGSTAFPIGSTSAGQAIPFMNAPNQPMTQSQNLNQQMNPLSPITPTTEPQPMTTQSTEFMNGFLRTQIGKTVRVEFLIGTGTLVDKFGRLLAVGANYLVLRQAETDDIIVCDFFTIKFVTFYL